MAANPNFDQILSTTLKNYRNQLTDNIFNSRPFWSWLTEKGRSRMLSGGHKIVEQLIHDEGEAGFYSEWDALSLTPQEGISAAEFPWKQVYASIVISGLQEAMNNGKEQLISLLEAKIMQAEETLKSKLSRAVFAETPQNAQDILSLGVLIGDENSAVTDVGGIDCSTPGNEFWQSYVKDMGGATSPQSLQYEMTVAYNSTSDSGSDRVDALFSSQNVFELYESGLLPQVRYRDVKSANAGFDNLMFKGVPMFWDFDCPDGTVYGINSKYLTIVGHSNRWFKQTPFSQGLSSEQGGVGTVVDARYSFITAYMQLTIRNRRRQFKLENIVPDYAGTGFTPVNGGGD